jgi:hypothetical protein
MFSLLTKILSKEKLTELQRQSIYRDVDGSYNLFGIYSVKHQDDIFVMSKDKTYTEHSFTDLRNAVAWATFDHVNNINMSRKVLELDMKLSGSIHNVKVYERLCRNTKDLEKKSVYLNKLNENRIKRNHILHDLESYVHKAKEWQYKQFELNSSKYLKQ